MMAGNASLFGQAPGTFPPDNGSRLSPSTAVPTSKNSDNLPVKGFLFLDESGTPVLMPAMSFEEIDRLKSLDAGIESRSQGYSFQSLQLVGSTTTTRAEFELVLRFTIQPNDGRMVAVPIGMSNFHPLGPPEVIGLSDYRLTGSASEGGHVLLVKATEEQEVVVKMKVSARITSGPPRTIRFQLPDVPSQINMIVNEPNVTGEIVGRGDEVIQVKGNKKTSTRFSIESGGGDFTLRWGNLDRDSDGSTLLEIDNSRIVVQWDSPQDQPLVNCQMIVRSVRGTADELRIRLPKNAVLFGTPTLGSGGQEAQFVGPIASPEGDVIELQIPKQDSQQRIDLNFQLQLTTNDPTGSSPLSFRVPEIIGALRQRGEVQIVTGDEFRLRWRSRPWVHSILSQPNEENGRSYFFRYDRAAFELPIWLATTHRQLRLSTESEISLHDSVARMEYRILPSGRVSEGTMLKLSLGDWRLRSIENLETGERIEALANLPYYEIFLESNNSEDPSPIRVVAEHDLAAGPLSMQLQIPRIADLDETMQIQSSLVYLNNRGRSSLVVDLEASKNLDRALRIENSGFAESTMTRYRVIPADATAELVGWVVEKSPRISLSGDATIAIEADKLTTTWDWVLTSSLDLQGRLPIQITSVLDRDQEPALLKERSPDSDLNAPPVSQISQNQNTDSSLLPLTNANRLLAAPPPPESESQTYSESQPEADAPTETGNNDLLDRGPGTPSWTVTVNNQPAVLQGVGGDQFVLISDQLSSGMMTLRWNISSPLRIESSRDELSIDRIEPIATPRPIAVDMTYEGLMRVALQGDMLTDLLQVETQPTEFDRGLGESENMMVFDALPRQPILVRLRSRTDNQENTFIAKAVLRTAVGEATRMEQLLAEVHGRGELRIGIPRGDYPISVEASVDSQSVGVRREKNELVITLPTDDSSHHLDLRVWIPIDAADATGTSKGTAIIFEQIEPSIELPIGVGRIFWEIYSPSDRHILWATPSLERSMAWVFDRLRLYREPTQTSQSLAYWVGEGSLAEVPAGNRYLYQGVDARAFRAIFVSRTILWMVTASMVLVLGMLFTFVPRTRHPFSAVIAAVLFAGILIIAPDAAVLMGQLGLIALVLVVVMLAIRSLVQSPDPISALSNRRVRRSDLSSQQDKEESPSAEGKSLSATRSLAASSRIDKVAP
ncbi:hypothetical protein Q31b_23000 [Novipirellula aureliae]|uniref:Uncharacterized protein n=2 Tax=Novipirellula aureliae TaxID=2527966 RepID=A0A5C6E2V6_9BACT|nr:hypothetical protein Q31b_23000 [Novipirellula aureliae]